MVTPEGFETLISMVKILGFVNGEIGALYIIPTAIVVILFALIGYAFVSVADFIRIRKIPMDVALKNVE